jgi:multidrug efflux pump subunit AcrB
VVDVDWYVEDDQPRYSFDIDREKAALSGVSVEQISTSLRLALSGIPVGLLHQPEEKEDVSIVLRYPTVERSSIEELNRIRVAGTHWFLWANSCA